MSESISFFICKSFCSCSVKCLIKLVGLLLLCLLKCFLYCIFLGIALSPLYKPSRTLYSYAILKISYMFNEFVGQSSRNKKLNQYCEQNKMFFTIIIVQKELFGVNCLTQKIFLFFYISNVAKKI